MLVMIVRRTLHGLESAEDQLSADVRSVGVAFNLLQMAKRVGPQCEAAEYEDLSGEKSLTLDRVVED